MAIQAALSSVKRGICSGPLPSSKLRVLASRRGNGWADWFEGLSFTHEEGGTTLLHGQRVDQAALYGLLRKVRDLGMPLISVSCVKPSQADE